VALSQVEQALGGGGVRREGLVDVDRLAGTKGQFGQGLMLLRIVG
jgi:hypothetical protein